MLPKYTALLGSLVLFALACAQPRPPAAAPRSASLTVSEVATGHSYRMLLSRFAENDANHAWTAAECGAVGQGFVDTSSRYQEQHGRALPTALYNAGLAFQRCGDDVRAKQQFTQAVLRAPDFHQAHTELALYEYQLSHDRDRAIERVQQLVQASKFKSPRALVLLAALELERAREQVDGSGDRELAHANLQRALALDDGYLPALNQLALYHLEQARYNAGQRGGSARFTAPHATTSRRGLDLAALVVEQALRRDDSYAPLYNTAGLIEVELENYTAASRAFARARELDPRFFEAHMNHAAVNLMFRGFAEAERAYRAALALEPKNYEAHLGLGLALRGQLDASNDDELRPEIDRELSLAAALAPDRPETDYNRALLALIPLKVGAGDDVARMRELERAQKSLETFIQKAGDDPAYAESVLKARARLDDLRDTLKFVKRGLELEPAKPWSREASFLR